MTLALPGRRHQKPLCPQRRFKSCSRGAPPDAPRWRSPLFCVSDRSRTPSAPGAAPTVWKSLSLVYRGAGVAPGREGTLEARLSPAPAGLPRGAPCTDARGARATNHLCRRRVPRSPSLGCVCRAGRGRPAPPGREPQRSPLSEAAGDANPWLSPRTLLGKVLHVPAQDTVWERPAAITAGVPKDDGVAQETGPQGAMPRGLSIGTEVACSNLCHSPRLPPHSPVCRSRSQTTASSENGSQAAPCQQTAGCLPDD